MSGQATVRSFSGLLHDLTDEEVLELTESGNRTELKKFLLTCAKERARNTVIASDDFIDFFFPLLDTQVPPSHLPTLFKYRAEARHQGIADSTPLCYRVTQGFTLKHHAPKAGPCHNNFQYLQNWNFTDEPTADCLVFWIPRLVPGSTSETVSEQKAHMVEFRNRLELPAHHCSSFGSAAILSGIILAHYKATGERVPLDCLWTRTDICYAAGGRLWLNWYSGSLDCAYWHWDVGRCGDIGVFALGVEVLGS